MIFQIIAATVLAAFYGCYFIKMICQRKQGIRTDQIGKGKAGAEKHIEVTLKIVTYLAPAVEVVSIFLGTTWCPIPLRITGAVLSIAGVAVFIISVLTMRDSWRAGVSRTDKTELVTDGIYQISRNPAFLGFDLVYIGILLMFLNWVLCIVSAFAMLMLHLQIVNVEEAFLLGAFGDEYLQYKRKVCRYIGRK